MPRTTESLIPNPRNPRRITGAKLKQLASAMERFGDMGGVVFNIESGQIVGGHQRIKAIGPDAELIITTEHPEPTRTGTVREGHVLVDGERFAYREVRWPPDVEMAANLAANKGAGEFDLPQVAAWMQELDAADFNLDLTMFDEDERKAMQPEQVAADPDPEEDTIPEPPAEPTAKPGDIWQLGGHRLMCGDSTNIDHVDALMNSLRAQLVFTSPPYSQQRDYGKRIDDWDQLMSDVFSALPCTDDAQILVNLGLIHTNSEWIVYWRTWLDNMRNLGWRQFGLYVWDQGPGMPGNWHGRLAPAFELVFHFNKLSRQPNKTKECVNAGKVVHAAGSNSVRVDDGSFDKWNHPNAKTQEKKIPDSVIRAMRHKGTTGGHPAPFSVAFATEVVEAYSTEGDIVFEPFGGSGTTLLACQNLKRKACSMELEPGYCDIIISRWEKLTGQTAELVSNGDEGSVPLTVASDGHQ